MWWRLAAWRLLQSQLANAISYPELPCHVGEVLFRRCLHGAFLSVLVKPNILWLLLGIEAEIPLLVEMLGPPRYGSLLCVLSFRSNLNYHLVEELDHVVFECLTGVSRPDRNKTLDQWLQVSSFRASDVRRLSLHFVN